MIKAIRYFFTLFEVLIKSSVNDWIQSTIGVSHTTTSKLQIIKPVIQLKSYKIKIKTYIYCHKIRYEIKYNLDFLPTIQVKTVFMVFFLIEKFSFFSFSSERRLVFMSYIILCYFFTFERYFSGACIRNKHVCQSYCDTISSK